MDYMNLSKDRMYVPPIVEGEDEVEKSACRSDMDSVPCGGTVEQLQCDFTWIVGRDDHMTTMAHSGWRGMVSRSFQRAVFPGDHFFIFNDKHRDAEIADECARALQRSLMKE